MSKQKSPLPGDLVNKYLVNKNQVILPKELSVSGWEMVGQDYDGASLRLILVIVALVGLHTHAAANTTSINTSRIILDI